MVASGGPPAALWSRTAWISRVAASPRLTMAIRENIRLQQVGRRAPGVAGVRTDGATFRALLASRRPVDQAATQQSAPAILSDCGGGWRARQLTERSASPGAR